MTSREDELELFKREIDLVEFAQSEGYELDKRRTSRRSAALRHGVTGDRVLVAKASCGHFVYASVRDHTDNGSIIDFMQNRSGGNLGEIRKALRPYVGRSAELLPVSARATVRDSVVLEASVTDFGAVREAFDAMTPIEAPNHYLEEVRGVPAAIYMHPRFRGRLRVDARRNVVFPHWQPGGMLTGYELKNVSFTGFAKGGSKRLFGSGFAEDDVELIVCETGIDVLSYAALFGVEGRRFVSTAGAFGPEQLGLLRSAMAKLPGGGEVVIAVDADEGGDSIAEDVIEIHQTLGRSEISIRRHSPETRGLDWNDVLCSQGASVAQARRVPGLDL